MGIRTLPILALGATLVCSSLIAAAPAIASSVTAAELPAMLVVQAESHGDSYRRTLFKHWTDADGDGCSTRFEVLIEESLTPVTVDSGCTLAGGTWFSPFDGMTWTDPSDVDIDHLVALSEAWRSGAWSWSPTQREAFANDLEIAFALTATTPSVNSQKSAWDPSIWLPPRDEYVCQYVTDWTLIKIRWRLTVDEDEALALASILSGECGETAVSLPASRSDIAMVSPEVDSPAQTIIAPFPSGATRLAGNDRYTTAIAVSASFAPNVPVIFVATGANFPDALSAASAAASLGGPLLLNPQGSLLPTVRAEIERVAPQKIVVVGGYSVISALVESELAELTPTIERQSGSDRYATGLELVAGAFNASSQVFLATGRTFPDALAASGAAGKVGAPVILVEGALASIPASTMNAILALGAVDVNIIGGTGAISSSIETQLRDAGLATTRLGGLDRFDTAVAINQKFFTAADTSLAFFATGFNFPDALAGAALAGQLDAPLFVTASSCMTPAVFDAANQLNLDSRVMLGGTSVVSTAVMENTKCVPPAPPVTPTPPPTPPKTPTNPGDSVNCSDFSTWRAAQDWFLKYWPYYGDIAKLDGNNDGIACESRPGAP